MKGLLSRSFLVWVGRIETYSFSAHFPFFQDMNPSKIREKASILPRKWGKTLPNRLAYETTELSEAERFLSLNHAQCKINAGKQSFPRTAIFGNGNRYKS